MTTDARHHMMTPSNGGVHSSQAFEYVNAAARTGATGLTSADIGKIARQLDDDSFWILKSNSPVTWASMDGGTVGAHASSHQNGGGDEISVAGLSGLLADDQNPTSHASDHEPGGGDAMAVDAAAATGSLRTIGTGAQQACAGNDSRLSDARTPTSHATSHQSGGGDAVKLDDLAAPDDNTDLDASTSAHGLLPKLGGGTTDFLRADGSWESPSSGVVEVVLIDVSAGSKTEYTTIAAAIAACAAGDIIVVGPGTWAESFTIPAGVTVKSQGGSRVTDITGTAATGTRVTMSNGSKLEGFRITTPTNSAYAVLYAGAAPSLAVCRDITLIGANTTGKGFGNTGSGSMEVMDIFVQQGSMAAVYEVTSGELLVRESLTSKYVTAITDHYLISGGLLALEAVITRGAGVVDGISISDGTVIGTIVEFQDLSGSAVHVTDDDTEVEIRNMRCDGCDLDIEVDSGVTDGKMHLISVELDEDKIDVPDAWHTTADHFLMFQDEKVGEPSLKVWGGFMVGSRIHGQRSAFGEGDTQTATMHCFRNTNQEAGTWSDVTDEARSAEGSTFSIFAGTAAGQTFYIGCSKVEFPGIFTNVSTAGVLGTGSLIAEFWNGTAWTPFALMASDAVGPEREQYGADISELSGELFLRFGGMPSWAAKTLDGQSAYWVRWRVLAAWTTSPIAQQFKLAPNSTAIAEDGFMEFFGTARPTRSLPWHLGLLEDRSGWDPTNETVDYSSTVLVGLLDNEFSGSALDGRAGDIKIPFGLDTSEPLTITVVWAKTDTASGDVELELTYSKASSGDVFDGTGSEVDLADIVTVTGDVAEQSYTTEFEIPIYDMVPGQLLGIALYRDGTTGNLDDTYTGGAYLISSSAKGVFWR